MEYWYPYVIGTVAFLYIQSFNRVAKLYFESEKTLSWNDFFTKVVPVNPSGTRTQDSPLRRRVLYPLS